MSSLLYAIQGHNQYIRFNLCLAQLVMFMLSSVGHVYVDGKFDQLSCCVFSCAPFFSSVSPVSEILLYVYSLFSVPVL